MKKSMDLVRIWTSMSKEFQLNIFQMVSKIPGGLSVPLFTHQMLKVVRNTFMIDLVQNQILTPIKSPLRLYG